MSKDNVTRRISIFVNGKEVENSLKGVEGAMAQVRNRMRLLNSDSETYEKDSKELAQTMNQLRERQSAYREELGLTNKVMEEANEISGGLRGTLTGIWDSLVSGDLQGAKEGISSLTSGMGGLIKSSLAFIATPIGAAIAGLAGLALGAKALFDYNKGLNEMNTELRALGVNASEISKVRDEISATAETFDKDFKEIAEKANSLSKTYGISMSEANQIIAEGLASGGAQNAEFLDSLGEYDEFFAKAGFSAKEFADVINTGYDLGIYSDKLPDALKEADLALKENTKSTRDALVNAFGASFSDDILNKVKTGELTTKQALEAIAQKAQESNLSQQQYAQLTADVFKGAGEDAGGAQKIFEALGQSAKRELDATAQASLRLVDANEKLNKAQSELFEIENFGDIWTGIKAVSTEALASMLEYLADVKKDIQPIIDLVQFAFVYAWENAKLVFVSVFDIISGVIKAFASYFGGIIQGFKKLLQGDFKGAFFAVAEGISNAFKNIGNIFINLYNNVIKFLTNLVDAAAPVLETLGVDVDKLKQKLEGLKGKKFEIKGEVTTTENKKTNNQTYGSGGGGATADNLAKLEAQNQKELENQNKLAEQKKALFDKAESEIDALILDHSKSRQINALTGIDKEIAQVELKYAKDFEKYKEHKSRLAELEALKDQEINDIKLAKKLEYENQIDAIEKQLEIDKEVYRLERAAEQATSDEERQLILIEKARYLAEQEIAAEMEKELAKVQNVENSEELKQAIRDKYAQKSLEVTTNFNNAETAIKSQQVDWTKLTEEQKLNATKSALNGAAEALNKGSAAWKAVKIAETTIATYQSAVNSYNSLSGIAIVGPVLGAIAAAAAVASGIAQVKQIANTKIEKAPKFFKGGSTGTNPALGYDEFGPVTGYVHKNEYVIPEVMTQDPRFANTIGWLEANRQSKMRGYVDGGETTPGVVPQNAQINNDSAQMNNLLVALLNRLENPIAPNLVIGYKDVENLEDMKTDISSASQNGTIG